MSVDVDRCPAEIFPSWSHRWITCGSVVRDGKCLTYGHDVERELAAKAEAVRAAMQARLTRQETS